MKNYIMFLLYWYVGIFLLLLFNNVVPFLFIFLMSIIYIFFTNVIYFNYKNKTIYSNNYFIILLSYILNFFLILLIFYYKSYLFSLITGCSLLLSLYNIRKNV